MCLSVCLSVIYRDALMTSVINCSTSFFSGFIIFMILGYMAQRTGQPIEEVATEGKNCSPSFLINLFASFVLWKRIRRSYSPYYCRLYFSPNFTVANLFRHMHLLLLSPLFNVDKRKKTTISVDILLTC